MREYRKTDKCLIFMCIGLFLFLAAGIASLCLLNGSTTILGIFAVVFFGAVCGAGLLIYAIAAVAATVKKSLRDYVVLSAEIVFVATFLLALSPIAFFVWIIEQIAEKTAKKE